MLFKVKLNKKNIIILLIIILIIIIPICPHPFVYQLETGYGYDNKSYYSLYKGFYIENRLADLDIHHDLIEDKYGKRNMIFSGYKAIVANNQEYWFYKTKDENKVLIKMDDGYAVMEKEEYEQFIEKIGYIDYDDLQGW